MFRGALSAGRQCIRRPLPRQSLRSYATVNDQLLSPGQQLHGFTVRRTKTVPELHLSATQFQHDKTGADYIHVSKEDRNNVFAVGFKTNPDDDTGVPHILEHTALCGSQKYPVRDPFFKMLNRSLSNFMNAFTSGDHTTYPFATTNKIDFYNLMDVYLDATLQPLLKEDDFKQEGWRVGPSDPADPKSPLVFKGVVYNEMKGQMSDSSYLYYIRFQDHIFPSIHNSGGDPGSIPDLSIGQLRNFHKQHYNPTNAKIFTYGNMPVTEHLQKLNEKLDPFSKSVADTDIREPITLDKPSKVSVPGPLDPLMDKDSQHKTSVSWLMNDTTDVVETFGLKILTTYLLDGYGAPLYKGLIDEKLGSDFSPNTGFDTSSKKAIFSVGLQNVRSDDVETVHDKIHSVLRDVKEKGFESQKIEGMLHQLELGLKHISATFGMSLMQSVTPSWHNGVDPFDTMAWEEIVSKFRERYEKGGYLEELLERYLLIDKTFTFTMFPDKGYATKIADEERTRLASKIEKSKKKGIEKEDLVEKEKELLEVQEKARHQDLSCLPTLNISDIQREMERKPLTHGTINNVPVQWRTIDTNGLTYFRAVNPLEDLPEDLRLHLPLFTEAILRLGTKRLSIDALEDAIKLKSGGIRASTHVSTNHSNLELCEEGLVFSGYCLDRNFPDMLELLRTVLLETNFKAVSKLRSLVHSSASNFVNSLAESGHGYAQTFAAAHLTPAARANEVLGGMTQVKLISKLAASELYADSQEKLKEIATFAGRRNGLRIAMTCGSEATSEHEKTLAKFIDYLPDAESPKPEDPLFDFETPVKAFFPLPYQVSYSSMCLKTVPYTHSSGAALQILAQLLTHKYLHHEIREKGGAYGGGAFHRGTGGLFGFYSYRDPNIPNTIRIMEKAGEYAMSRDWSERDLADAKLSVFQGLDAPMSVSEEGMIAFMDGITDEMRQERRERLLDVGVSEVKSVAEKFVVEAVREKRTALAVLGERNEFVDEHWNVYPMSLDTGVSEVEEKVVV